MTDWKKRGACLGYPAEVFHPENPTDYRHAVKVCERCVVKARCLEFALQTPGSADRFGVYGGMTPPQRRRLRLEREQSVSTPLKVPYEPTPLEWDPDAGIYREERT